MRLRITVVAAAVAALAAGCGGDGGPSGPTATSPSVTVTETTSVTVTTGTETTTEPATTRIPWPPAGLEPGQNPVLRTPSGNIECGLDPTVGSGVVCNAYDHAWRLPPKPASCEFEWTDAVSLRATGRPEFWCSSNAAFYGPNEYWPRVAFPYGASVTSGTLRCTSRVTGVTCTNGDKHGFVLSRERVAFF